MKRKWFLFSRSLLILFVFLLASHTHTHTYTPIFLSLSFPFPFPLSVYRSDCVTKTANLVFSLPFSSIIYMPAPPEMCVCSGWCVSTDELNCDNSLISLLFISVIRISLYTYSYNIPNIGFYRATLSEWQHIRLHICSPKPALDFLFAVAGAVQTVSRN